MLQGYATKNGTGISIYGDYGDLKNLYNVVHTIATSLDSENKRTKGQHQLLMNFAYEIRKAYSGQRLNDKIYLDGNQHEMQYFGFNLVWTDVLIFIATLRYNAGFIQTNKLNQAILYILEYIIEEALFIYDPDGANVIKHYIGQRINITNEYAFIIYQAIHLKFIKERASKKRFRDIPKLVGNYFSEWKKEYIDLIAEFHVSALEQNCEITDLEFEDFPDIKW